MTEEEMNSYRLTSLEEPSDEQLAQIMREAAEEARERARIAKLKVAGNLNKRIIEAKQHFEKILALDS